jgi:intracellular sulfur oxidation DsrE/DsrF family protein
MIVFQERGITHLDLHGEKHADVDNIILDFVYQYQDQIPLIIICGNSVRMIDIVSDKLNEDSNIFSSPRFGIIRVERI